MRTQNITKRFVCWVWQIGGTPFLVRKCEQETVSEPIILAFGTVVGAPLKINDLRNFVGQVGECVHHSLNIRFTCGFFEREEYGVPKQSRSRGFAGVVFCIRSFV